jgi:hypothetical protein
VPSLGFAAHSPEVFVVDGHAFQARTTLGQARDATRELTGRNRGACALNRREVMNYFTLVPQISEESLLSKYPILRRRSRHSGHSRVGGHPASPSLGHYLLVERSRRSRSQAERCPRDSGLRVGGRSDGLEDAEKSVFPGPIALLPLDAKAARTVRWTFGARGDRTTVLGEPQPKNTTLGTTEHPRYTATSKPGGQARAEALQRRLALVFHDLGIGELTDGWVRAEDGRLTFTELDARRAERLVLALEHVAHRYTRFQW